MDAVITSLRQLMLLVFAVLLQQLGAPVPAIPTVVLAGALSVTGVLSAPAALTAAILASLVADTAWYAAGIRYGRSVLTTLCRISLSPDSCVRQSEDRLARWGPWALVIGKFVPGLSTMAPPVAGLVGLSPRTFAVASTAAAALYFGLGLALGMAFHDQVNEILAAARARGDGRDCARRAACRVRRVSLAAAGAIPATLARRPRVGRGGQAAHRVRCSAGDPRRAVRRRAREGARYRRRHRGGRRAARDHPAPVPAGSGDRGLLQLP
jgi:membrane protein DedA with SNARE-associated domain